MEDIHALVKSVSIEGLVRRRDRLLEGVGELIRLIGELNALGGQAGALGGFDDWFVDTTARFRHAMRDKDPIEFARIRIDRAGWEYLINESGITTYMDAKARSDLRESLTKAVPPLTIENITATFHQLYHTRGELFERGVVNLYRSLSWSYRTNLPVKFGRKIILDGMVTYHRDLGFSSGYGRQSERLNDLDRVFHVMDGKPEPDYPNSLERQFRDCLGFGQQPALTEYDEVYVHLRWFKKGSMHVTFKREDLVEELNRIIAKHYPDALPAR